MRQGKVTSDMPAVITPDFDLTLCNLILSCTANIETARLQIMRTFFNYIF